MGALLEIANVSKRFGGLAAVSKVSFTVQEREILSVIGPNAASSRRAVDEPK